MRITAKMLREASAREEDVAKFEKLFPDGAETGGADQKLAEREGLDSFGYYRAFRLIDMATRSQPINQPPTNQHLLATFLVALAIFLIGGIVAADLISRGCMNF